MVPETLPLWKRATAFVVDGIILIPINLLITRTIIRPLINDSQELSIINYLGVIFPIIYSVVLTYKMDGATLGKKLVKSKVIAVDGHLGLGKIILRTLVFYLFFGLTPFLLNIIFNKVLRDQFGYNITILVFLGLLIANREHRGIHDWAAGTRVVKNSKS